MKKSFPQHFPQGPYGIIGYGKSGQSAYKLLETIGVTQNLITIFDDKNSKYLKPNLDDIIKNKIKTLVVSPGFSLSDPFIIECKKLGIPISSELNLCSYFLDKESLIGITGSVGKSTTTSLCYEAIKAFNSKVFIGGNWGIPLSDYIIKKLTTKETLDWIVLELSSYQLEILENYKFQASLLTSFMPNHLERYSTLEDYYQTKTKLLKLTDGPCYLNQNSKDLVKYFNEHKSLAKNHSIVWSHPRQFTDFSFEDISLVGSYNHDNLNLILHLIHYFNWPTPLSYEALKKFKGLPHRLEKVTTFKGITFINDSKATTIGSVLEAVQALHSQVKNKLHIYIGGRDKNLPWEDLSKLNQNPYIFHFFGECGKIAQEKSKLQGDYQVTLKESLEKTSHQFQELDIVLLSPGGTSLDEFQNFEERGIFFKNWVMSLDTHLT